MTSHMVPTRRSLRPWPVLTYTANQSPTKLWAFHFHGSDYMTLIISGHTKHLISTNLFSGEFCGSLRRGHDWVVKPGGGWYSLYDLAYARGICDLASLNKTKVLAAYFQGMLRRDLAP